MSFCGRYSRRARRAAFARFIDGRPEFTHVRTRKKSPETNGVIERYHGTIKIECPWRHLPADGLTVGRHQIESPDGTDLRDLD